MLEDGDKSRPLVFLSYSHSDAAEASRLRNDIIAAGIKVWWDKDLLGGQDWRYEIREAIRQCDAVILCLSKKCLTRRKSGIYPEALDAIAVYREYKPGAIFLIPVRFSECRIPSIEIDGTRTLDRLHHIDLFPHEKWDENLQKIIASIECASPPQQRTVLNTTSMATAVSVQSVEIEITIDRDFESYTEADQARFLLAIRELLKIDSNIKIKRKRSGSVKIILELSPEQAEELLRAIKAGQFEQYGAVDAELKAFSDTGPARAAMVTVLIVNDERSMRMVLSTLLKRNGIQVVEASGVSEALRKIQQERYDVVITELKMDDGSGLEVLRAVKRHTPDIPVIILSGYATVASAVEAMKLGAFDYLVIPFERDELLLTIHKALERNGPSSEQSSLQATVFLGKDPKILALRYLLERVASTDATVLITGESGTGKELVARWIHAHSRRLHAPLVVVDSPSVPVSLFESELFGHERGAFTGASQRRLGKLAEADGGTLFLDEIGELPLEVQAKLLRFLQEGQVTRIGGSQPLHVNTRVISATNRDLAAMVEQGTFRGDLFYRLNVIQIEIPPLRERQEDIPLLVSHFVEHFSRALGTAPKVVAPELLAFLVAHSWPGNVRELENVMQRVCTLETGNILTPASLPPYILSGMAPSTTTRIRNVM